MQEAVRAVHVAMCLGGLVACGYPRLPAITGNDAAGLDAISDASIDGPPDPQACFGTGIVKVCLASAPTMPLMLSSPTPIDTDTSPMCAVATTSGNYCVIAATTLSLDAVLRAAGSRPLILLASDSITIGMNGAVDVGSHRDTTPEVGAGAEPVLCAAGIAPGSANSTNGGGAGGSFMGRGGYGGRGGIGGPGGAPGSTTTSVTELRGGCAGQDGQGPAALKGVTGHGGGAVLLIAGRLIDVNGTVNASGEGGTGGISNASGGGGGGAGGMIGFDAPAIAATGLILADGGGAGQGSGATDRGDKGADPTGTTGATGGFLGPTSSGGVGGDGSAGAPTDPGNNGADGSGSSGGGGGGGGIGLVKAPAAANLGTNISPPSTP